MPRSVRRLSRRRIRRANAAVLPPPPSPNQVSNPLPVAVELYWGTSSGSETLQYIMTVLPNTTVSLSSAPVTGQVLVAAFYATGAGLAYTGTYANGYTLGFNIPNTLPLPSGSIALPPDTPPVLVGAGVTVDGALITREQFWTRSAESYSLAPNEVRTTSITQTTGVTSSSSSLESVSETLSTSASIGWGPVSASISATLNASSTVQHQLTLTDQTTTSSVVQLTSGDDPVLVIYWQLVDRVLWWNSGAFSSVAATVAFDDETIAPTSIANSAGLVPQASLLIGQLPVVPVVSTAFDFAAGTSTERRPHSESRSRTRKRERS
jgi:hypothetical protein